MFNTMKVANTIKSARIAKNMTQMNLADEMGVSYQAVSNWERGNSMPDISKLGQLCELLGISIEELLGEGRETQTVVKIMNNNADEADAAFQERVSVEELQEVAAMLPPTETKKMLEENVEAGEKINLSVLIGLAPFLESEYLGALVDRVEVTEHIGEICGLAPFLEKDALDKIVDKCLGKSCLAEIVSLAPFLSKKTLDKAVQSSLEKDELDGIVALAPFLSKSTLHRVAEKLMRSNDMETLTDIGHFL